MTMLAKKEMEKKRMDTGAGAGAGARTLMTAGAGNGRALTIADYEARIFLYREQAAAGFIGIGQTLIEAQEAGVVPHGEWESWVENVAGMNIRQAQRCMKAAREIREGSYLGRIDMSKAMLLLGSGLDEEEQETLGRMAAEEGASVRELKEEIRKLKLDKVQTAGANAEIRTELKKAQQERDQIKAQLQASLKAFDERRDEIAQQAYERGRGDGGVESGREKVALEDRVRKLQEQLKEAEIRVRDAEAMARKNLAESRQAMEAEIREEEKKKADFLRMKMSEQGSQLTAAREEVERLQKEGSARWDEGFRAGMNQAADMAREAQDAKGREIDELAGTLEAERKEWTLQLERMRADLEAAEEREAKRARELAELKKEKAQAGMDAARGIRAEGMNGLDLASAVRSFIGAAGVLPQMGRQLSEMGEKERGAILAQVDTVARWVDGVRRALGVVNADVSVM